MTLPSRPMRIIFDPIKKVFRDETSGEQINNETLYPSTVLLAETWVNVKFVKNSDLDAYDQIPAGTLANVITDNDYNNAAPLIELYGGDSNWTADSGEYKYFQTFDEKPSKVYFNSAEATEGTVGSLALGEWGWDSGNSILYVRLSDDSDPDGKGNGYVEVKFSASGSTRPFIEVDATTFNQSGSWWDVSTESYRDPKIEDGEVSYKINSATYQYYQRIGTSPEGDNTRTQVQLLDSNAKPYDVIEFYFRCKNIFLGSSAEELGISAINYYNKAEILTLLASKANKGNTGGYHAFTFIESDLDSSRTLTITHNLKRQFVDSSWYDDEGREIEPDNIDGIDENTIYADFSGFPTLSGVYSGIISYGAGIQESPTFEEETDDRVIDTADRNKIIRYTASTPSTKMVTLDSISDFLNHYIGVRNESSYDLTIVPSDSSETILGDSELILKPDTNVVLIPNGATDWQPFFFSNNEPGEWVEAVLEYIDNITIQFSPSNYTPTSNTLAGHLEGIDNALSP